MVLLKGYDHFIAEPKGVRMNTYISMLRGINVSGQKKIAMSALVSMYERLGLTRVRTYVQSGNVVFESDESQAGSLKLRIEAQIQKTFNYEVPVIVRRPEDLQRILGGNPFLRRDGVIIEQLYVTFLDGEPATVGLKGLPNPNADGDEFVLGEQELFLWCPNGFGRTKLNNNFFERKLKVAATTRNWKTVTALQEMVGLFVISKVSR